MPQELYIARQWGVAGSRLSATPYHPSSHRYLYIYSVIIYRLSLSRALSPSLSFLQSHSSGLESNERTRCCAEREVTVLWRPKWMRGNSREPPLIHQKHPNVHTLTNHQVEWHTHNHNTSPTSDKYTYSLVTQVMEALSLRIRPNSSRIYIDISGCSINSILTRYKTMCLELPLSAVARASSQNQEASQSGLRN